MNCRSIDWRGWLRMGLILSVKWKERSLRFQFCTTLRPEWLLLRSNGGFRKWGYPEITRFNQWECPLETINFGVPPFTENPEGSTVASDGILICHKVLPTWDCPKAQGCILRSATVPGFRHIGLHRCLRILLLYHLIPHFQTHPCVNLRFCILVHGPLPVLVGQTPGAKKKHHPGHTAPSLRCNCEATRFPKHMRICSCCGNVEITSCENDFFWNPPVENVTCPCSHFVRVSPVNIIVDTIMTYSSSNFLKDFESVTPLVCLLYKAIQVRPTHQKKKWYSNIPRSQMSNSVQSMIWYIRIGPILM